jgi:hypothetical protein
MTTLRDRNRYVKTYSPVRVKPVYELDEAGNAVYLATQTSHGFQRFDFVRIDSDEQWHLSDAADPEASDVDAIVIEVVNANNFKYRMPWSIIQSTHFVDKNPGDIFYLDPATPGGITDVEPVVIGHVSKPVLKFLSTDTAIFLGFRGIEILETPTAQIIKAKDTVRVATTEPLSACSYDNGLSGVGASLTADADGDINDVGIDGVTDLQVGDRVLVKDEADKFTNGFYRISAIGSATDPWVLIRTDDANVDTEVVRGIFCSVNEGTENIQKSFILVTSNPISLGSTDLEFNKLSSSWNDTGLWLEPIDSSRYILLEKNGAPGVVIQNAGVSTTTLTDTNIILIKAAVDANDEINLDIASTTITFTCDSAGSNTATIRSQDEDSNTASINIQINELQINSDPGAVGEVLTSAGPGAPPVWATASGGSSYVSFDTTATSVSTGQADVTLTGFSANAVYSIDTATLTAVGTTGASGYAVRIYNDVAYTTLRNSIFGGAFSTLATSAWQTSTGSGIFPGPRPIIGGSDIYAPVLVLADASGNIYVRLIAQGASAGTLQFSGRSRKVSS